MISKERMRDCQQKSGLTQEEIARQMNVSLSKVRRWLSDKEPNIPDANELQQFAQIAQTSVSYLLCETEDAAPTKQIVFVGGSVHASNIGNAGKVGSVKVMGNNDRWDIADEIAKHPEGMAFAKVPEPGMENSLEMVANPTVPWWVSLPVNVYLTSMRNNSQEVSDALAALRQGVRALERLEHA